jgi:hypothetical protein
VVETQHLGRVQRFAIKGVANENASTKRIEVDGVMVTVQQYYRNKHSLDLR